MKRIRLFLFSVLMITGIHAYAQTGFKVLTQVVDAYPVLSPDGTRIVFTSNRTGTYQVYTCDAGGGNIVQLTHTEGSNVSPVWSPGGDRIVFASERDDDSEIYIMNADGTGQKRLTRQPGDDSHPKFSPDGSRIIFNSAMTTPDLSVPWLEQYMEIFTMDTDGNNLEQVTFFKSTCTYPVFSPDGKKIVFRRIIREPGLNWSLDSIRVNSEIFVMNNDGSDPVNISNSPAYDGWPCWMPDSKTLLFSSNRGGTVNMGQLYSIRADGTGLRQITGQEDSFIQASVSKDGKTILAQRNRETDTYEYGYIVAIPVR